MIICVCKSVSDSEIKSEVASGTKSYEGLQRSLGVGTQCGSCSCEVKEILQGLKAGKTNWTQEETLSARSNNYSSGKEVVKPLGSSI